MPIVNMPIEPLLRLINARGPLVSPEQLPERLHDMGVEVEETTDTHQYICACSKVIERTEAQGPPLHCPNCGRDFRDQPDALRLAGTVGVLRLNLLAVRPDIFDMGGMARYARGFLGSQPGLATYEVAPPKLSVRVDPRLSHDDSFRPAIACAVLRGLRFDHELIKFLMNLQEDLHWALGRDRKLASIGVYDLDALAGGELVYEAVAPDGLRFVPLGFPAGAEAALTPREVLERHKTGREYAHLLRGFARYPLLRDAAGGVLSMPPIINSEATRVTLDTRQCFVDVTGLAQRTVDRALAILVTSLKEVMPAAQIERVTVRRPEGAIETPDLSPQRLSLAVREAAETVGVALDAAQLAELLGRMGHDARPEPAGRLAVSVGAWRNDVMHAIDLVEDAAVAYGYDNLVPRMVPTVTIAAPREIEEQSGVARRVFTGLGFHQVITLVLSSEPAAFDAWGLPHDPRAVRIENPISGEQTICRVSLLPGLMQTLAINKRFDLPQHIFEIGDVCLADAAVETGAREERFAAAALIGTHVGFADVRAVCDAFAHEMGAEVGYAATEHVSFIPGRVASLFAADGARLGTLGELHPRVIEHYGLRHPVALLEFSLARLLPAAH